MDYLCMEILTFQAAVSFARGNSPIEKLNNCWEELQNDVNGLLDKENNRNRDGEGLKQVDNYIFLKVICIS